ncbi:MAG: flavin reductase family protein [candidate division KSB1 bacterium]|nr:flavin reductase family protein [candidate division KSB1 bacterium]
MGEMRVTTNLEKFLYFYPKNVTLVGVRHAQHTNFMAVAWNTALSFQPPLFAVAIAKKRFTHRLICEAGNFTCNFLPNEKADVVHSCGRISGTEVDKVARFGLELEPSQVISSPGLRDAYAILECTLESTATFGDHDLFVGRVEAVHFREEFFDDNGALRPERVHPTLYLGADTYLTTDATSLVRRPRSVTL